MFLSSTLKYKIDFEKICQTGTPVLILKKGERCDCYDPTELINSEPKPYCKKCFGLGYVRNYFFTENIRHEPLSEYGKNTSEVTLYNSTINNKRIFFFPERYFFITTEDLIATFNNDKIISVYKVINKEIYNVNDFAYAEIIGEKINFISTLNLKEKNG